MSASLDHVIALARGGAHDPGNVQLSHVHCNVAKGVGQETIETEKRIMAKAKPFGGSKAKPFTSKGAAAPKGGGKASGGKSTGGKGGGKSC